MRHDTHPSRSPFGFLRTAAYWRWAGVWLPACIGMDVLAWGWWQGVLVAVSAWGVGTLLAVVSFRSTDRRARDGRITRGM